MSLRTKLVLAFLMLAIVPLSALTLYSYYSSTRAFRRIAEAESAEIARNMSQRMELVSRDLNNRLNRLGDVPFQEAMNEAEGSRWPEAEFLYRRVMNEFGDAATLISSLEFEPEVALPDPASPAPGEHAGETRPGRPEARDTAHPGAVPRPPPSGRRIEAPTRRHPDSMVFVFPDFIPPGSPPPPAAPQAKAARELELEAARRDLESVQSEINVRLEQQRLIVEAKEAKQLTDRLVEQANRVGAVVVHELSQLADAQSSEAVKEGLGKALAGVGDGLKTAVNQALTDPQVRRLIGRTMSYAVRLSGQQAGTVRAQVDARRVVGRVFSAARRRQGEIPFAIDKDGNLFTENEEEREQLVGLQLENLIAKPELAREMGDWLVVSREEPDSGMIFGIARPIASRLQEIQRTAVFNLLFGLGIVGVALVGILPLSGRMTRNLESLSAGARQLATGDLEVRVPVRSRDEFGKLAVTFNRMAERLKEQQGQLVEQERIRKELEMCRLIQEELLPQHSLRVPFAEVKGVSIPAREVGGDFFNYFALVDGKIAILIGDVSGKGVAAALLMANLQATLRARVPVEPDLAKLAGELDVEIYRQTPAAAYLTLFLAILDGSTGTLRWVNAGHNPQYALLSGGEILKLESTGRPLGLIPGGNFGERQTQLAPGESLFLYTDGLVEAEDSRNEQFGEERLEEVLRVFGNASTDSMLTLVEEAVRTYRSGTEAGDDATMVVLRLSERGTPDLDMSQKKA